MCEALAVQVPTKIIPEGGKHIPWNEAPLAEILWFGPWILTFFFLPPHIPPLYISSFIEACPVLQVHGHNELPNQAIILYGEESYALFKYLPSVYLIFKWFSDNKRPSFLSQNLLALTTTCLNNAEMFSFDTSTRMDQFPYTCTLVRDQILKLFCSRTLNMVCLFGISAPCLFDIIYSPRLHLVYAFVHLCLDVAMAPTPDLRGWRRVKWMRVKGLELWIPNWPVATMVLACHVSFINRSTATEFQGRQSLHA